MREAHLEHVGQQRLGKLEIADKAISPLHHSPPGAEMDLVNADRAPMPLLLRALRHPLLIAPLVALEVVNHRRSLRTVLTEKPKRIALEQECAGHRPNLKFVMRALLHARDENFPDTASDQFPHRVDAAIPKIEVANHAHPTSVRRPNRKISAAFAPDLAEMRAKSVV